PANRLQIKRPRSSVNSASIALVTSHSPGGTVGSPTRGATAFRACQRRFQTTCRPVSSSVTATSAIPAASWPRPLKNSNRKCGQHGKGCLPTHAATGPTPCLIAGSC
ncbi:unnamed protein product, partial [Phaeothamnion confervicola]